ncbi:MAG TPA: hypothetical protein DDW65_03785 [Firmicutes bacterium]|nr:hypothetical protein [Bacillota bacterium]
MGKTMILNAAQSSIISALNQIRERLPVIDRTIDRFGGQSLEDYCKAQPYHRPQPLQPINDLVEVVRSYCRPILGQEITSILAADLEKYPLVLTANHHGVDYFAQSFQGNLLFHYYRQKALGPAATIPVFSCGGVPLCNSSYPKGLLIYRASQPDTGEFPYRLSIFPNVLAQTQVLAAPRFQRNMVEKAIQQLYKSLQAGEVSKTIGETVLNLLEQDYLDDFILNLPLYSAQVTALNHRLGRRIFTGDQSPPQLIYLEFETIAAELIKRDLADQDSLTYRIFFDPDLRRQVIQNLDHQKGCWDHNRLTDIPAGAVGSATRVNGVSGYGTIFFWGLDIIGQHYPLTLVESLPGGPGLAGVDGQGICHEISFTPAGVLEALERKQIYPNLFTMFMVVSFARGVECHGGYFQSDYLPAMQAGLIESLQVIAGYERYADAVASVTTNCYMSGMMFLLDRLGKEQAGPAGPLELMDRGGITPQFLKEVFQSVSVDAAHQIGIFNIYPDVFQGHERLSGWQLQFSRELIKANLGCTVSQ